LGDVSNSPIIAMTINRLAGFFLFLPLLCLLTNNLFAQQSTTFLSKEARDGTFMPVPPIYSSGFSKSQEIKNLKICGDGNRPIVQNPLLCLLTNGAPPISKPPIDSTVFGKWPQIQSPQISNDGNYMFYNLKTSFTGISQSKTNILTVVSIKARWSITIDEVQNPSFSNDSKQLYFRNENDSLGILSLATKSLTYMQGIASFGQSEAGNWFAYLKKGRSNEITIINSSTGKKFN
jgi:hypothetical protein